MSEQNIFELLTRDPVEFNTWSLKSKLMIIISLIIKENNWTQLQAAEALKISQPRVSNLSKGKMDKFSIDLLLELVFRLGFSGDITFNPDNKLEPITLKIKKTVL